MCNSAFKELDVDYPAWGAVDRYRILVAASEERAASAAGRGPHEAVPAVAREAFRDNTVVSRFELFLDGRLAGYAKYTLVAGLLTVDLLFVPTAFRGLGFEDTILRLVSLSAHKRRLALVLRCREAPVFVRDNPSYAALLPRTVGTPGTVERVPDERAEPDLIEN
ncbi:hypothetical protein MN0502_31150 [Arthrobacter sp. MN05-02]|nr:hypothetical protein MN0502_31150 [Arthrobacter sp. MN05-02]